MDVLAMTLRGHCRASLSGRGLAYRPHRDHSTCRHLSDFLVTTWYRGDGSAAACQTLGARRGLTLSSPAVSRVPGTR